jgi:predicted ribosomally synthesized peptide with SipW-like signal peptide
MRQPPPLTKGYQYPVVVGIAALAIATTLAWWSESVNLTPLFETYEVRKGQLWRLITSMLPHGTVWHLVFNLYWLWVFGTLFEEIIGHVRTLGLILLLALGSGAADFAFDEGGYGLSGVVYGIWAAAWVLGRFDERYRGAVDANTNMLFVAWFVLCIVLTINNVMHVANLAHGAGAVLGALLALAMSKRRWSIAAWCGAGWLVIVAVLGATMLRPHINLTKSAGDDEGYLGYDALMANKNAAALKYLQHATRMHPENAHHWYNKGLALHRLERYGEAKSAFDRAHHLDPNDADIKSWWESYSAWGKERPEG